MSALPPSCEDFGPGMVGFVPGWLGGVTFGDFFAGAGCPAGSTFFAGGGTTFGDFFAGAGAGCDGAGWRLSIFVADMGRCPLVKACDESGPSARLVESHRATEATS